MNRKDTVTKTSAQMKNEQLAIIIIGELKTDIDYSRITIKKE